MKKTIQLWITVLVLTISSSMALTSCSNEDHHTKGLTLCVNNVEPLKPQMPMG